MYKKLHFGVSIIYTMQW